MNLTPSWRWTLVSLLALVGLALSGCGRSDAASTGEFTADGEIPVGEFGSLSGAQATFGQTTHEGIQLAVNEVNAAGGIKLADGSTHKVKLITYDNRSDKNETNNVVTRLLDRDHVFALLGEVASSQSLVAAPLAQKDQRPMISPSSTNPAVTQVGDMIFRVCFIDPDQGWAVAKFAHDDLKLTKVAVLYDQKQAYSVGLRQNFIKAFTAMGGTITTDLAYSSGDAIYSTQLNAIAQSQPEGVFVPGYYNEVARIAIQAREVGLKVPLLGSDGWETPDLSKLAEGKLEGCFYSNHYAPEDQRPESVRFVKAYSEAYKHPPGALAALGYDAALVLFDAMKKAPSLKGADLAKAIAQTKDFPGVTGRITLNASRDAVKPMVMLEIKNGESVYKTTINPPSKP